MLARTHFVFGVLTGVVLAPFVAKDQPWLFTGLVAFASLLPDVDHIDSTINKLFPVTKLFALLFKHRGFFHSIYPAAIIYGLLWWAGLPFYGLALAIGYVSHLISDCLTLDGVDLLYPLLRIRVEGFVRTGTMMETLFFVVITGVLGIVLLARYGLLS